MRIEELARRAGNTVRNIRAYQDRGLLPPPRRAGRVAYYSEAHLARLRLIDDLVARGYSLAGIRDLLSTWEAGRDIGDLLGLEEAIGAPWSTEAPETMTAAELAGRFGVDPPDAIDRAVSLGLLVPDGDAYRVPSPRLLEVAGALRAAGVPLSAILEVATALREETDRIAALFVDLAVEHVVDARRVADATPQELAAKAELVRRLRPLAEAATTAALQQAMGRAAAEGLREQMEQHFTTHRRGPAAS